MVGFIYHFYSFIKKDFFSKSINFKEKYGNGWVAITGSSEGIGFGFAEQFAKINHKILFISRNEQKLKSAANELSSKYPNATIKYEIFDFNKDYNEEDIQCLKNLFLPYINDEISILFNNVGAFEDGYLIDMKNEDVNKLINVNSKAPVFVSKIRYRAY